MVPRRATASARDAIARRALAGAAVMALVTAAAGCGGSETGTAPPGPGPAGDPAVAATAPPSVPHDHGLNESVSPPPRASATPLVERFARAWVRHDLPAADWWNGISPMCTDELAYALRTTDPGNVPASRVTGDPARVRGGASPVYAVPTDAGTLLVTVSPREGGWLVSDLDYTREVQR